MQLVVQIKDLKHLHLINVTEYFLDLPIKVYLKYLKVYFLFHCFISGELSVYSFRKKTWKIVDKIVERFSYADCGKEESIYINWWCTLDNKTICKETNSKWDNLKNQLLQNDDSITTVTLQYYSEVETVPKNGKLPYAWKQFPQMLLSFIIDFISQWLSKVIHWNQIRHYWNTITGFREHFSILLMNIDFSENL